MECIFIYDSNIVAHDILEIIPDIDDTITIENITYIITSRYYKDNYVRIHLQKLS